MITGIFDTYIQQYKPHLVTARDRAEQYAERIIAALEVIGEEVRNEEFLEPRHKFHLTIPGGTTGIVDLTNTEVTVPASHTWVLEVFSCDAQTVRDVITLMVDGKPTVSLFPQNGGTSASVNETTAPVYVNERSVIQLNLVGPLGSGNLYLQFKDNIPHVRRRTRAAGMIERAADLINNPARDNVATHSTPGIYQGVNVHGERHP